MVQPGMAYKHKDPPYEENLLDGRISIAETYKQDFDSRLERDDWELHRAIRDPGVRSARKELSEESSVCSQEYCYDLVNPEKVLLKIHWQHKTSGLKPCIFFIHGGLMTGSDRYVGVNNMLLDWGRDVTTDAIVLSVEYGRPPHSRGIKPSEDCWEAFCWAWRARERLGIDPDRTVIYGASAGGCLATSIMIRWLAAHGINSHLLDDPLFSRFRGVGDPPFPSLKGVYLEAPMLDDRHQTISRFQYAKGDEAVGGNFTSTHLGYAWGWLLNEHEEIEQNEPLKVRKRRVGTDDVSILEVPGRATAAQLEGFPPVCVEVGDADPLRDEGKDFIDRVKASSGGTEAEYKLFHGGVPHGGWAIDTLKKEKATRDILSERARKLGVWLA